MQGAGHGRAGACSQRGKGGRLAWPGRGWLGSTLCWWHQRCRSGWITLRGRGPQRSWRQQAAAGGAGACSAPLPASRCAGAPPACSTGRPAQRATNMWRSRSGAGLGLHQHGRCQQAGMPPARNDRRTPVQHGREAPLAKAAPHPHPPNTGRRLGGKPSRPPRQPPAGARCWRRRAASAPARARWTDSPPPWPARAAGRARRRSAAAGARGQGRAGPGVGVGGDGTLAQAAGVAAAVGALWQRGALDVQHGCPHVSATCSPGAREPQPASGAPAARATAPPLPRRPRGASPLGSGVSALLRVRDLRSGRARSAPTRLHEEPVDRWSPNSLPLRLRHIATYRRHRSKRRATADRLSWDHRPLST